MAGAGSSALSAVKPTLRFHPGDIRAAAGWGVAAGTFALYLVQIPFQIELSLYDKWGKMNGAHKIKYRSIMFNSKDANNPDFRRKVLLGQVKPETLLNMTTEEMASEQRKLQNQKVKEKAPFDCELGEPRKLPPISSSAVGAGRDGAHTTRCKRGARTSRCHLRQL